MLVMRAKQRSAEPKQQLFQVSDRESKSNSRYCLHRLSKHKNRNVTRSLHSIEVKPTHPKHTGIKAALMSDREHCGKRSAGEGNQARLLQRIMNNRSHAAKLHTIEGEALEENERKLIGCIQMMQGVLDDIQSEKESRQMFKSVRYLQPAKQPRSDQTTHPPTLQKQSKCRLRQATKQQTSTPQQSCLKHQKENQRTASKSKFEEYIQNVCKSRQNSKVLLIRKAKTKSTIINSQDLKSSLAAHSRPFETINDRPTQDRPQHYQPPKRIPKVQIIVENPIKIEKGFQEMQVSVIHKVNQSSFISDCGKQELIGNLSDCGKQELIGNLSDSRRCVLTQLQEEKIKRNSHQQGSASKAQEGNFRKLCKVKNSKKLKSIFPSGFF